MALGAQGDPVLVAVEAQRALMKRALQPRDFQVGVPLGFVTDGLRERDHKVILAVGVEALFTEEAAAGDALVGGWGLEV